MSLVASYFIFYAEIELLHFIGENTAKPSFYHLFILVFSFNLISSCFLNITGYFNKLIGKSGKKELLYSIFIVLILIGLFIGLLFCGKYKIDSYLFLILSFMIWIGIGTNFFLKSLRKDIKHYAMSLFGACIGGITAGFFIGFAYAQRINFSIDEGYFLLTVFLLCFIGVALSITFILTAIVAEKLSPKNYSTLSTFRISKNKKAITILAVILLVICSSMFSYWERLDLNNDKKYEMQKPDIFFFCSKLENENIEIPMKYCKEDVIKLLEKKPNRDISTFAILYILSQDDKWADEFKTILLQEANEKKFANSKGSVKGFQYHAMIRAYYFLLVTEKNPCLFNETEKNQVVDYFKEINEDAFRVRWVDLIYALLQRKLPAGPYPNQEMGIGLLSILSEAMKDEYPELSKRDKDYTDEFGVGWKGNFRNPDDMIVYGQSAWITNAYMLGEYGGQEDYLRSDNAKKSFEWILLQWPSNGMSPAYNVPSDYTPFDIMILGGYLFKDGRYFWLAQRMLEDEIRNIDRQRDLFVCLDKWDENLPLVQPKVGSCYIKGTTGTATKPGPLKPDKIVFREGWTKDSIYALLNLRFSGWHSYKATNCFVSIMHGEPFVAEKLELRQHSWLPKAKADHRDKKIMREELNGFQIEKIGFEKIVYEITGFGSPWAQDPPRFAEVIAFNSTPIADYAITKISDWHGWTHERASVLVKGKNSFLVVFDYAKGKDKREVGISWHLKGDSELGNQAIRLSQANYSLNVHYPYSQQYKTEIFNNKGLYPPAGEIHDPDIDFWMISKDNSKVGFIILFYPEREDNSYKVEKIDVSDSKNQAAYPNALGVKVARTNQTEVIGASLDYDEYNYDTARTDSKVFILEQMPYEWEISFYNGSFFNIISDKRPTKVILNKNQPEGEIDWSYRDGMILIKLPEREGHIRIKFEEGQI